MEAESCYRLHPLTSPRQCTGYPPAIIRDEPENELNFLLEELKCQRDDSKLPNRPTQKKPTNQALACSLVTSGSHFNFKYSIATSEELTQQLLTESRKIDIAKPVIIICHGFMSWRNQMLLANLASKLSKELGVHTLRFDFTGNGHSSGEWKYANYKQEVEDLGTVVNFVKSGLGCKVGCIIGHSHGFSAVLHYSSMTNMANESDRENDRCKYYVNLAGRFSDPDEDDPLSKFSLEQREELKDKGCFQINSFFGDRSFTVTKDRIEARKMHRTSVYLNKLKQNDHGIKFLTIHGSADSVVPVDSAHRFRDGTSNHLLRIIEGADHNFNGLKFIDDIASNVIDFLPLRW